jgi:peptide/nickel transport system substrate-binding protein
MCLLLLSMTVAPLAAQDADPGPGQGGIVVESNPGDDPSTFNPVISSDTASSDVTSLMYPSIIGLDDVTLEEAPDVGQALATGWSYDETGTVLTLNLREDITWADGEPITAEDWVWAYEAIRSGETISPRVSALYDLADGSITGGTIHDVTMLDDYTLEIRLGTVATDEDGEVITGDDGEPQLVPNCEALSDLNDIPVVPAHAYEAAFGGDYGSMSDDPYFVPETPGGFGTFGPFTDPYIEFGVQTSLLADQSFPDTELGYVAPSEWLYQNVEDLTVAYERFLAGDFTWMEISASNQNDFRQYEGFQTLEYPSNGYAYMGYNLADPDNPQPGRDAEGNIIDQGLHPVFGDVQVRQALAYAVDVREMIGTRSTEDSPATGILEGNGYPIATHNHPGLSSTDDELAELGVEPYPFDPEIAATMLEEAGWVDIDDDGIRECQGCLYAQEVDPEYEGSELEFELLTNAGNNIREAVGETIRAQLEDVGVRVNFQAIEFGTLVDVLLGQQFDAVIISWSLALPFNPGGGLNAFFGIGNDRPDSGFNTGSYHNPELDELVSRADSLPAADDGSYEACDQEARDDLYAEGQRIIWEDQPYLFLYATNTMVAGQPEVGNFDPLPYNPAWNIDAWAPQN